jgi:hypothetical protein
MIINRHRLNCGGKGSPSICGHRERKGKIYPKSLLTERLKMVCHICAAESFVCSGILFAHADARLCDFAAPRFSRADLVHRHLHKSRSIHGRSIYHSMCDCQRRFSESPDRRSDAWSEKTKLRLLFPGFAPSAFLRSSSDYALRRALCAMSSSRYRHFSIAPTQVRKYRRIRGMVLGLTEKYHRLEVTIREVLLLLPIYQNSKIYGSNVQFSSRFKGANTSNSLQT